MPPDRFKRALGDAKGTPAMAPGQPLPRFPVPVGARLARGALRAAMAADLALSQQRFDVLERQGFRPPASFKQFAPWLARHRRILGPGAVFIAERMTAHRRAELRCCWPAFLGRDQASRFLCFELVTFLIEPGRFAGLSVDLLPVRCHTHAIERLFERERCIDWVALRSRLRPAAVAAPLVHAALVLCGCRQGALPIASGMFIGNVEMQELAAVTYISLDGMAPRWRRLHDLLAAFIALPEVAAMPPGADAPHELVEKLANALDAPEFRWLRAGHNPRLDQMARAWESRESR